MRILIVEDDPTSARYLELLLKTDGYQIIVAESGKESLSFLETHKFDLVLLDLYLPDISGIDILKEIRVKFGENELPVIVVTASYDEKTILELLDLGANDFTLKPYNEIPLKVRIKNQLKIKTINYELKKNLESRLVLLNNQKNIFENIPIGLLILDRFCVVKSINSFGLTIFGKNKDGFIDVLCGETVHCINAMNNKNMCGKLESCLTCMIRKTIENTYEAGTSTHVNGVLINLKIDDKVNQKYLNLFSTIIDIDGEKNILLAIEDITEEKTLNNKLLQSEERLNSILNEVKDVIWSLSYPDLKLL
ncbi:MAG TPA: response regulator, partial [Spirochaetota bacterium]|nr:response regulator [Spirochaetota bacterium]